MNELLALGYNEKSAKSIMGSMGSQLRSAAPLIKISAQIYRDYPALRDSQLTHFLFEKDDGERSLKIAAATFPKWLLHSHQAINGATALAADYLFDRTDFFEPYKQCGFEELCTGLVGDVTGSKVDATDSELVTAWLNRLNLKNRFEWITL